MHASAFLLFLALGCRSRAPEPIPGAAFEDVAQASGLRFEHRNGRQGNHLFPEITGAGVAFLDYDNDGDLDAYLVQAGRSVDGPAAPEDRSAWGRLFRNDLAPGPDGSALLRFTDVTEASGIRATGYGQGVAVGDYDNDGWPDLYLTSYGPNQLWRNRGDGTFDDVTASAGGGDARWSTSALFVDYDRDGWLDLFVAAYVDYRPGTRKPCLSAAGVPDYCGPENYAPETHRLFRNRGDGTFEDVSGRSGILAEAGSGLGVVAADFDRDGWADIYVANDQMRKLLWMNQRDGTFRDNGLLSGTAFNAAGDALGSMGVAAGDPDDDGDPDLFVTNLDTESATLYANSGDGLFEDRSAASGVAGPSKPYSGWGTAFFDYDNDGRLDVATVNGLVLRDPRQAAAGVPFPYAQQKQLFQNRGAGLFDETSASAGPAFVTPRNSRGLAVGDVDNDGDADLLVGNIEGPAELLLNRVGSRRHWLGLRLLAREKGRDMLGAEVTLRRGGKPAGMRLAHAGGSCFSSNDPRVLVGLGAEQGPSSVEVRWPDGRREAWNGLAADTYHVLVQGRGTAPLRP
jgi:hypothetical protein